MESKINLLFNVKRCILRVHESLLICVDGVLPTTLNVEIKFDIGRLL
jgi:hypothetical protein